MRFLCNQLSFVSDIPAVDVNIVNLYLQCRYALLLHIILSFQAAAKKKN
jgi:hypothetical protein